MTQRSSAEIGQMGVKLQFEDIWNDFRAAVHTRWGIATRIPPRLEHGGKR